jgi:MFS family permease
MSASAWSPLFHGRRAALTVLLTLGVGVHAVDVFIVATVLPSIVVDIGGAAFYTWATMVYIVASILGTASGAFVRATQGLRRGYIAAVLVFLVGSVGCAVAPHMLVLLAACWSPCRMVWSVRCILRISAPACCRRSLACGVLRPSWVPWWAGCLPNWGGGAGRSGSPSRYPCCSYGWSGVLCLSTMGSGQHRLFPYYAWPFSALASSVSPVVAR